MRICPSCTQEWPEDRYNSKFADCFRCRARTVSVSFAGGKEIFHSQTVKEGQDRTVREAKANGYDPVPAWTSTYAGFAGSQATKLAPLLEPTAPKVAVSAETTVN